MQLAYITFYVHQAKNRYAISATNIAQALMLGSGYGRWVLTMVHGGATTARFHPQTIRLKSKPSMLKNVAQSERHSDEKLKPWMTRKMTMIHLRVSRAVCLSTPSSALLALCEFTDTQRGSQVRFFFNRVSVRSFRISMVTA